MDAAHASLGNGERFTEHISSVLNSHLSVDLSIRIGDIVSLSLETER
jgi:hypothetical protein